MTDSAPEAVIEAMAEAALAASTVGAYMKMTEAMVEGHFTKRMEQQVRLDMLKNRERSMKEATEFVRAALSAASRAGFVLVPVEATEEMVEAAHAVWSRNEEERYRRAGSFGQIVRFGWAEAYYSAMIAARPGAAPTKQEE